MKKLRIFIIILLVMSLNMSSIKAENTYHKAVLDITSMSIKDLQDAVDKGYLTYEQITKLYLDRVNAYEDQYNAFITINDNAVNEAKELDQEYQKSGRRSMIYGLPIVIKDNIDVVGMPTTIGTNALNDAYPKSNAPAVQKLIDAGAIILAKTNMSEFAFSATTSYSSHGMVKNAYNTDYTTYGSSGGTAVAVAANLAVAGLGTDTNSSVRLPASANNLVGIRPTYGIISGDGVVKYDASRDTIGVMSKYIEDNAIILNIIDNLETDYTTDLNTNNLNGITIGVVTEFMSPASLGSSKPLAATNQEIIDLMNDMIEKLEEAGASIVYINEIWDGYSSFMGKTFCYDFNQFIKNTSSDIQSLNELIKNGGYVNSLSSYKDNYCTTDYRNNDGYDTYLEKNKNAKNKILKVYENNDLDVVIYPTSKNKLLALDEVDTKSVKSPSYTISPVTGMPSLNIPIGYDRDKLPYGMELLGLDNSEALLYKVGSFMEDINNFYKNPDIAPPLYTIPSDIKTLMQYNETKHTEKEYQGVQTRIKDFFTNYDTLEVNKIETTSKELTNDYKQVATTIKENQTKKSSLLFIIIITMSLVVTACGISLIIILKQRKDILNKTKETVN